MKLWLQQHLLDWMKRKHPEMVTAMTLYNALRAIKDQDPEYPEYQRHLFIFSIIIYSNVAMPLIVDAVNLEHEDAVTLDAWWTSEAKPLVQPIVDKINFLTGDYEK